MDEGSLTEEGTGCSFFLQVSPQVDNTCTVWDWTSRIHQDQDSLKHLLDQ